MRPRDLERSLVKKFGFNEVKAGSDHRWYRLELEGVRAIHTKVSHSRKELGKQLLGVIAKQLQVNSDYLLGMVRCFKPLALFSIATGVRHWEPGALQW